MTDRAHIAKATAVSGMFLARPPSSLMSRTPVLRSTIPAHRNSPPQAKAFIRMEIRPPAAPIMVPQETPMRMKEVWQTAE